MKLWQKILLGMVLGIATGMGLRLFDAATGFETAPFVEYVRPVGEIFIKLIRMLVVLLIFSSLTVGITSIHDPQKLGRVGLKTLVAYFLTTVVAICLGMGIALIVQPGEGVHLPMISTAADTVPPTSLTAILFDIVPENPIGSLASGNVLQVLVFSVFLGIAINFAGEKAKPLLALLESIADVMYRLTSIVMEFAPYGAYAAMAWASGTLGVAVLWALAQFLGCILAACAIQVAFIFCGFLAFVVRLRPSHFFRGMGDAIALAFSTSSSSATLPVSLHCVQENLGVSKNISSFVLPLGATVNMNGTAIFQGITAIFFAQAYQIDLSIAAMVTIVITASLSAIGAAGIPGTGFTMMTVVLDSVGLPKAGLDIILGINPLREMFTTVVNILGDAMVAVYVAKGEGEFDEEIYYHKELVDLEEDD